MTYNKEKSANWYKEIRATMSKLRSEMPVAAEVLHVEVSDQLYKIQKLDKVQDLLIAEISAHNYTYKVVIAENGRKEIFNPSKREVIGWFLDYAPQAKNIIDAYLSGKNLNNIKIAFQEFGNGIVLTFVEKDKAWRVSLKEKSWFTNDKVESFEYAVIEPVQEDWSDPTLWLDTDVHIW